MEMILEEYENEIMDLVYKLDDVSKINLISKIEDTFDRNTLLKIYKKSFLDELEQTEKELAMGDYVVVDSLKEIFGE